MSSFIWKRELTPDYPNVWLKFQARDCDSDALVEYRVQDLPEERFEDAFEHMRLYYMRDEPICNNRELYKDKASVDDIINACRQMVQQRMALVCFKENSNEIVGLNMTYIALQKDRDTKIKCTGKAFYDMNETVFLTIQAVNIFAKYKVDKYLSAFGLSIAPKYRGQGIAKYILRARVPLCKAMGIKLTSTVFTAICSQKPAASANFVVDYEITYEELSKMGSTYHYPGMPQKSIKVMSLPID